MREIDLTQEQIKILNKYSAKKASQLNIKESFLSSLNKDAFYIFNRIFEKINDINGTINAQDLIHSVRSKIGNAPKIWEIINFLVLKGVIVKNEKSLGISPDLIRLSNTAEQEKIQNVFEEEILIQGALGIINLMQAPPLETLTTETTQTYFESQDQQLSAKETIIPETTTVTNKNKSEETYFQNFLALKNNIEQVRNIIAKEKYQDRLQDLYQISPSILGVNIIEKIVVKPIENILHRLFEHFLNKLCEVTLPLEGLAVLNNKQQEILKKITLGLNFLTQTYEIEKKSFITTLNTETHNLLQDIGFYLRSNTEIDVNNRKITIESTLEKLNTQIANKEIDESDYQYDRNKNYIYELLNRTLLALVGKMEALINANKKELRASATENATMLFQPIKKQKFQDKEQDLPEYQKFLNEMQKNQRKN